jgi:hypothetical protein
MNSLTYLLLCLDKTSYGLLILFVLGLWKVVDIVLWICFHVKIVIN